MGGNGWQEGLGKSGVSMCDGGYGLAETGGTCGTTLADVEISHHPSYMEMEITDIKQK